MIAQRFKTDIPWRWCFKKNSQVCSIKWFIRRIKGQGTCSYCIPVVWRSITLWSLRQLKTKQNYVAANCASRHYFKGYSWSWTRSERADETPTPPCALWGLLELNFASWAANCWTFYPYTTTITRGNLLYEEKVQINLFTTTFQNPVLRHVSSHLFWLHLTQKTGKLIQRILEGCTVVWDVWPWHHQSLSRVML